MNPIAPFIRPHRFLELHRRFGRQPFRLLDVGAGNHSATSTKRWFPHCHYAGVDKDKHYNNDERDFAAMDEFFEMDLTRLEFGAIPDASYDAILLAHVIEHLENGDDVLRGLTSKLKPGGLIVVEFPGPQSLHMPSRKGTLNFHDDESHVRVFDWRQVAGILRECGLVVEKAGTRRDLRKIVFMPVLAVHAKWKYGFVPGGVFWDLYGFADEVVAVRPAAGSGA
jgi:SAM-dependent methyltransferase